MTSLASALEELGVAASQSPDLMTWAEQQTGSVRSALLGCPDGEWLLRIALHAGLERSVLVSAAVDCARLALPHAPDDRVRSAIEVAQRWAEGRARPADCWAAALGASQAAEELGANVAARSAARAAAAAAFACDVFADPYYYADKGYCADAVVYAAEAHGRDPQATRRRCADLVRGRIDLDELASRIADHVAPRRSGFPECAPVEETRPHLHSALFGGRP